MTTIRQSADQLAQALRRQVLHNHNILLVAEIPERFAESFNSGQKESTEALAAYDAACAQLSDEGETQCVWDAPMSKSTAKRVTVLQQARVEELERTVEAWEQCSSDLYRTLQNCGPTGHAAAAVLVQLKANVAELLKEKANG